VKEMNKQVNLFERGLESENWEKATNIFAQLKKKDFVPKPLEVNTKKIFENQFTFPQLAQNTYVIDELDNLEAAQ